MLNVELQPTHKSFGSDSLLPLAFRCPSFLPPCLSSPQPPLLTSNGITFGPKESAQASLGRPSIMVIEDIRPSKFGLNEISISLHRFLSPHHVTTSLAPLSPRHHIVKVVHHRHRYNARDRHSPVNSHAPRSIDIKRQFEERDIVGDTLNILGLSGNNGAATPTDGSGSGSSASATSSNSVASTSPNVKRDRTNERLSVPPTMKRDRTAMYRPQGTLSPHRYSCTYLETAKRNTTRSCRYHDKTDYAGIRQGESHQQRSRSLVATSEPAPPPADCEIMLEVASIAGQHASPTFNIGHSAGYAWVWVGGGHTERQEMAAEQPSMRYTGSSTCVLVEGEPSTTPNSATDSSASSPSTSALLSPSASVTPSASSSAADSSTTPPPASFSSSALGGILNGVGNGTSSNAGDDYPRLPSRVH
ncbi:hypothetical protein BDZ97DRAFT_2074037 [Flammula alnicola]|nr:hypothetical protein BDZ97DRAFT_2074037 [Flammula alnicola]